MINWEIVKNDNEYFLKIKKADSYFLRLIKTRK